MAVIRFSLLAATLALPACAVAPEAAREQWAEVERPPAACKARLFEGSRFTLCWYDPKHHRLELVLGGPEGPLRSFAALADHLGTDTERLMFAMNGGMYDGAGMPIGLYVEDGIERKPLNLRDGPGNFHMKPNGVFAVDGRGNAFVVASEQLAEVAANPAWATQSGPMLVIGGEIHPRILPAGTSRLLRNGVCAPGDGSAWFAISEDPVSFGRLARLFRDGLNCPEALYLDGNVSSLWDKGGRRRDGYSRLGPLIAIFKR
jgi:uncharacterized protein YigE (DUF2233 family)